jgi:hypothetical protein
LSKPETPLLVDVSCTSMAALREKGREKKEGIEFRKGRI